MNISLLYLVSSVSFLYSPVFVGNHVSFINGRFEKFSSLLFYNQKNLLVKGSIFNQIYGSIIHNTLESNHIDITDQFSYSNKFNAKINTNEIQTPKSISIINCAFNQIYDMNCNPLKITNRQLSVYITNTVFNLCQSLNGVIFLEGCRCLTITHTCSFKSHGQNDRCFLFYRCGTNDFSIILYNSILESGIGGGGSGDSLYDIDLNSGDQYLRCNNMTKVPFNGFKSDAAICFSFAMTTINTCSKNCISISGDNNNNISLTRKIEMVNLNNYQIGKSLIRFSYHCSFQFYAKNCVFLAISSIFSQDSEKRVTIKIEKCLYDSDKVGLSLEPINCDETKILDTKLFTLYPHFTYDKLCPGNGYQNKNTVRACNVGNCLPNDCERTIGFPEGVIPYTSAFHDDLQTPTFSSTDYFSKSFDFSNSNDFSKSSNFLSSKEFTKSSEFLPSRKFSYSDEFSKSFEFTPSSKLQNLIITPEIEGSIESSLKTDFLSSKTDFVSSKTDFMSSKTDFMSSKTDFVSSKTDFMSSKTDFVSSKTDFIFSPSETDDNVIQPGGNLGNGNNKDNKGKMIGIIVGVVAAVAIIAIVTTVVLIKKRNVVESMSEGDVITQETVITVDNTLQNEMDKDDPFATDFKDL